MEDKVTTEYTKKHRFRRSGVRVYKVVEEVVKEMKDEKTDKHSGLSEHAGNEGECCIH